MHGFMKDNSPAAKFWKQQLGLEPMMFEGKPVLTGTVAVWGRSGLYALEEEAALFGAGRVPIGTQNAIAVERGTIAPVNPDLLKMGPVGRQYAAEELSHWRGAPKTSLPTCMQPRICRPIQMGINAPTIRWYANQAAQFGIDARPPEGCHMHKFLCKI